MDTLKSNALSVKIIAHRGASGEFPENSLLAFEHAILQQADAIELDVHFHESSGQYVVMHDHYLPNESNNKRPIQSCTIDEILNYSLGQEQFITNLQQVLQCIAGRVPVNIELKSYNADSHVIDSELTALKSILEKYSKNFNLPSRDVIISSFNHKLLVHCKQLMPTYEYGALIAHLPINVIGLLTALPVNYLNVDISAVNSELVQSAQNIGIKVNVYTVDENYDIQRCIEYGVDGIFTNWPASIRQKLQTFK